MLRYLKTGFIAGVPARDLTDEEVKKFGKTHHLKSGHYQEVRERKQKEQKQDEPQETAEE